MTLETFILDHFGTKELAARRLKVARWSMYRWLKDPDSIQLRHYKRLAQITDTDVNTLITYGAATARRAASAARKGTGSPHLDEAHALSLK
jgi:hypothetical protein